jgi:hypothetical protein
MEKKNLDVTGVPRAMAVEARGEHAGLVEDETVVGEQIAWEITEGAVLPALFGAMQDKHARGVPFGKGLLSDEFTW